MKTAETKIFTEANEVNKGDKTFEAHAKRSLRSLGFLLLISSLAGCAVGPDYKRPDAIKNQPLPKNFTAADTNGVVWKIAEPSANQPRGDWWSFFSDDTLNSLETLAQTNNQTLAGAFARFQQAHDLIGVANSQFFPQLNAGGTPNGDLTRQRTSVNEPENGKASGFAHTYDTFTAPVYLGWEMDLWGRVRRMSEAARAQSLASLDDLESSKLSVAAEVANDYFTIKTLNDEYTLVTNTIESYRRSFELTQNLRKGGAVSDLDVAQAETQLRAAEAQLPAIELQRTQTLHVLVILCGEAPVGFLAPINSLSTNVPVVPPSLPSELLEHRPDIAAAERRMIAANANVGVAKAAFFPTVKIDGLAGFQSISFGSWFNWSSRMWSVGPSLELPIFTGGYNRANLKAAHAAYDATVADYRQTVLTAFGEVEDQLAAQKLLATEWSAENDAAGAAQRALDVANNQYKAGLTTYLDVATAQTLALSHEQTAVQLEGQRLTATVNLIKALGGGWEADKK
jgi:outer membrane protein, multidrug efflux system